MDRAGTTRVGLGILLGLLASWSPRAASAQQPAFAPSDGPVPMIAPDAASAAPMVAPGVSTAPTIAPRVSPVPMVAPGSTPVPMTAPGVSPMPSEASTVVPMPEEMIAPEAPPDGVEAPAPRRRGLFHRWFHHTAYELQDKFIGYPDTFKEPPLGYYVRQQMKVQVAKANPHRFTLYRSDFLPDTDRFSPIGASRFNQMAGRLPGWSGPILIEWAPDRPELAQSRRKAVIEALCAAGMPTAAQRVVIGPSPYPGARGVEAVNQFSNQMSRNQAGANSFPLPPVQSSSMGIR